MSKQKFAKDLISCMEPISHECLCDDQNNSEKEDPKAHADYCPVYLYDYIRRVAESGL